MNYQYTEKNLHSIISYCHMHSEEEIIKYKTAMIPDVLYKYISLRKNETKLNSQKIEDIGKSFVYCCKVEELNDPFEGRFAFFKGDNEDDIRDLFSSLTYEKLYISSMTSVGPNSMPMWAYYANNHEGFCLKLRTSDSFYNGEIYPVFYSEFRDNWYNIMNNVVSSIMEYYEKTGSTDTKQFLNYTQMMIISYCVKHSSWKSEKEFRIIQPYQDHRLVDIEKIYLGRRCQKVHEEEIVEIAKKKNIEVVRFGDPQEDERFSLGSTKIVSFSDEN